MAITLINHKTGETVDFEDSEIGKALEEPVSIIEYVEKELATFGDRPFSVVDSLVLAQTSYMDFSTAVPGMDSAGEGVAISSLYRAEMFEKYTSATLMPPKNLELIKVLCASPRFRDIKINWFVSDSDARKEQQFCAMTFILPTGQAYVCFRGTDTTINGWKEDFNLFFLDTIPGQLAAKDYLEAVAAKTGAPLYVGGHSKGGNLAMYAASFADRRVQERIVQVYNHDGPGLTKGAMAKPEYSDLTEKINITLPRSSVVGLIFCHGNYTVIKSDRIGIMQHDPFSWEIRQDSFIYYREVKPGANNLTDTVYELMETLDEKDRELFIDTVFEIIYAAGATTFSEFPLMAVQSRDRIMETLKNIEPETADKMKNVISELIKISARKAFRIPESEIGTKLNEGLGRISEKTEKLTEKVTETTDRISAKVSETTGKITGRVAEATEKITETRDRITERLTETTGKLSETLEKARNLLKKDDDTAEDAENIKTDTSAKAGENSEAADTAE